ncbi:MAG: sugar phosphate isomerase/epimerase family protein [Chloroflexota bacterium]
MERNSVDTLARLSLNQATTQRWSVREAVEGCRQADIPWIGLWRDKVAETGLLEAARLVREAGLRVSSLCRGGMFPATTAAGRRARIEDNLRAVDEAATLGTDVLVLVCGAAPDRDLDRARGQIEEGIAAILPHATACGVKLGLEPLHPMFAADRSAIVTLSQALTLIDRLDSTQIGVVIDVYHVWWDPELYTQIARATGRIVGFHINDWLTPVGDTLLSRGMMGDGVIEIGRIGRAVEAAGYGGPVEVEIFNRTIWDTPGDIVLTRIKERFARL